MAYSGPYTLSARVGSEIIGSIIVYLLAVGVGANALLPKTKGQGMGFLGIAIAAGLGIILPIIMFQQVSGWFNPSFLVALWVQGQLSAGDFFALFAADMVGFFIGAVLLWVIYLPHFNSAVDPPACTEVERLVADPALLTQPALLNASYNLDLPSITSPSGLWAFFLGELKSEVSKVAGAQRLPDPLGRCTTSMRAVHSSNKLHSSDEEGGGAQGAGAGLECVDVGASLGEQLRHEADPRRRIVFALTKARQDCVLSVFCTRPAVFSPLLNLIQEFVSTGILVTVALMVIAQARFLGGELPSLWASQSAFYAGLTQTTVILALGGATGPAMNAARDTAPRLAHSLLPIPGKGCSEWYYGWVPFVGTLAGGAAAGSLVNALVKLLKLE